MDATTRAALEALYAILLSAVVQLARALDKPCPVVTRADRRRDRGNASQTGRGVV
jgi:hypothetical protein